MSDFNIALEKVLKFEGGYNPKNNQTGDPETIMGMTQDDKIRWDILDSYKAITDDMREFGQLFKLCIGNGAFMDSIKNCYKNSYWDLVKGNEINNQNVANNIFDFAVNAGVHTAVMHAQSLIDVKSDGLMGNITLNALNSYDGALFVQAYKEDREDFYHTLVANKPNKAKYLVGWLSRVEAC